MCSAICHSCKFQKANWSHQDQPAHFLFFCCTAYTSVTAAYAAVNANHAFAKQHRGSAALTGTLQKAEDSSLSGQAEWQQPWQ